MIETYIDIDSSYRDRILYPNPFDIKIERSNQVRDNMDSARNIICDSVALFIFDKCTLDHVKPDIIYTNQSSDCDIGNYFEIINNDIHYFFKITSIRDDCLTVDKDIPDNLINSIFKLRKSLPIHPINGSKCKVKKVNNGSVYDIRIVNSGTDYKLGEELKIIGGDNNCILRVNGINNTKISSLKIIEPGTRYSTGQYTVSGSGMGCTLSINQVGTRIESDITFNYGNTLFYINNSIFPIISKFHNCIIIRTTEKIKRNDNYEIIEFTEDGVKDMKPLSNEDKNVEISLINLIIPNKLLSNVYNYPYILVEFYSGSKRKTSYQSNNPNLQNITFKCIMNQVSKDDQYIRLCGLNPIKMPFNMEEDITFKISSPNGNILKFNIEDNKPPQRPNKFQINATFHIKTI